MAELKIAVEICGTKKKISLVKAEGEIDSITASKLEDTLDDLLQKKRCRLIVNLSAVTFISSAGWGAFISRVGACQEHKGDLKLVGMIPEVYEAFRLLEFQSILNSYTTVEEAIKSYG